MIIGTAGHIDHGKSALVKALTGIDPDRLKEEKLRGITLDLGFAHLEVGGTVVGIVDVPGHEGLVHNMLAGAGGMDMALVVVAADEGVKPQTVEHVEILDLLGITAGIGVINKIDLVGEEERAVARLEVEELFAGTSLAGSPLVDVSARTGEGIEDLRRLIEARMRVVAPREPERPFRVFLDRVFTLRGFGTVVTGTALAGEVSVGQELDVLPVGGEVRVRGIQVHGTPREHARAGERVALNVTGRKLTLERGFALAERGIFTATDTLDCRLRVIRPPGKRARPIQARLFLGTEEVLARVVPLESPSLGPGEGYAQLRTVKPITAARGDRFILRTEDDRLTLGGGIVIDAFARRRGPRRGLTVAALRTLEGIPDEEAFDAFVRHQREGLTLVELARVLNVGAGRAASLAAGRQAAGTVLLTEGGRLVARSVVDETRQTVLAMLSSFHEANPMRPAMALSDLRTRFQTRLHPLLELALGELAREGRVVVEGGSVREAGHQAAFDGPRERTRQRVVCLYEEAGLQPPGRETAIARLTEEGFSDVGGVIEALLQAGELVSMTHDLLVHARVLEEAKRRLRPHLAPPGVTVSQAREVLGTSRKYAVPLLELLDRQGFTVRRGDMRVLSPAWGVSRQES